MLLVLHACLMQMEALGKGTSGECLLWCDIQQGWIGTGPHSSHGAYLELVFPFANYLKATDNQIWPTTGLECEGSKTRCWRRGRTAFPTSGTHILSALPAHGAGKWAPHFQKYTYKHQKLSAYWYKKLSKTETRWQVSVPIECWFQVKGLCLMTHKACCCWTPHYHDRIWWWTLYTEKSSKMTGFDRTFQFLSKHFLLERQVQPGTLVL